MRQLIRDRAICGEFNAWRWSLVLRLAIVVGCTLLPMKPGYGTEPAKRTKLGRWFRISKIPLKLSEQALRKPPTHPHSHPDRIMPTKPVGDVPPAGKMAASSFRSRRANSEYVGSVRPVAAQSLDGETAATISLESNDAPLTLDVPPAPEVELAAEIPAAMSLEMLTALADAHHPRLMAAFQRVQAAEGRAVQAGLYPNPKVAVSSPQLAGNESQYNGFASQEFVTAGKLKLSTAAAQREVSQAQLAWQQERFFVLTDLRQKFFATLAAQNRVSVLEKLVRIAQRSQDMSQKLFEAGEGGRGDTLLLDIEQQRADVALTNARTVLEIGKKQLAILVAVPEISIECLSGDLDADTRTYEIDEVRFAVASVNPQANIARLEIERITYLLQRARVEPIPNIDVMGGYQRQVGIPAQDQGLFQITMSIPLWNKNQGNIAAAQAELSGARADLSRVELDLANSAAEALATLRTAEQIVERYEIEILPKARETLKLSQDLYAQGEIDFLRLLQSQKTLLEAELSLIAAQEQRWVSAAALAGLLQDEAFP